MTLYKDPKSDHFEEKEYKFVLEDEGSIEGRKALGVFSINIGQFADMLGSSNEVTMEMKPLVKKVKISASNNYIITVVFVQNN